MPDEITLAKEPPLAPLQLSCIALNTHPSPDPRIAGWTLPPPLSVVLTHMCLTPRGATATTMSVTHRFRNKFVTVVIYKPRLAPSSAPSAAASASASASFAMASAGAGASSQRGVGMDMEEDDPYAEESRAPGHDRLMPPPPGGMWAPGTSPGARPPFQQEGAGSRKVSWSDLPRAASAAGSAAMDVGSRPPSQSALYMDLT